METSYSQVLESKAVQRKLVCCVLSVPTSTGYSDRWLFQIFTKTHYTEHTNYTWVTAVEAKASKPRPDLFEAKVTIVCPWAILGVKYSAQLEDPIPADWTAALSFVSEPCGREA